MDKAADLLRDLATKLGVTVEHLWPMLVGKTRFDYLGTLLACLICVPSLFFISKKIYSNGVEDDWGQPMGVFGAIISTLLFIVSSVILVTTIANLGTLFYPEAATIENLLSAIGGHH